MNDISVLERAKNKLQDIDARTANIAATRRKLEAERGALIYLAEAEGDANAKKRVREIDVETEKLARSQDDLCGARDVAVDKVKAAEAAEQQKAQVERQHEAKKLRDDIKAIGMQIDEADLRKTMLLDAFWRDINALWGLGETHPSSGQAMAGLRLCECAAIQRLPHLGSHFQFNRLGAEGRNHTYGTMFAAWSGAPVEAKPAPPPPPRPPEIVAREVAHAEQTTGSKAFLQRQAHEAAHADVTEAEAISGSRAWSERQKRLKAGVV